MGYSFACCFCFNLLIALFIFILLRSEMIDFWAFRAINFYFLFERFLLYRLKWFVLHQANKYSTISWLPEDMMVTNCEEFTAISFGSHLKQQWYLALVGSSPGIIVLWKGGKRNFLGYDLPAIMSSCPIEKCDHIQNFLFSIEIITAYLWAQCD